MTVENLIFRDDKKTPNQKHIKQRIAIPRLKTDGRLQKIAFFGSADISEDSLEYQQAFEAAKMLAANGKIIVNGGGPGIMNASTKGADAVGGKTIAITFYPQDMPEFEGRAGENVVTEELRTTNYIERMMGLLSEADAFIIFRGGTGTLSEWATAWLLAHLYYDKYKPIFLYGDFWHDFMAATEKYFLIGPEEKEIYRIVENNEQLLDAMHEMESNFAKRRAEEEEKST